MEDDIIEHVAHERTKMSYEKEIHNLRKEKDELLVLIDTLQTNLRSASAVIPEDKKRSITEVQSYKWCLNWRPTE